LLQVFLDINFDNKVKANENLYNFVNIFVTDLEFGIQYSFIFPKFLYKFNPEKCKKVLDDLDLWINDSFTHHLPPLHQYVLFNMIETWIEWKDGEDDESELLDADEDDEKEVTITDDQWVENHPNDLELLKTLFFNDLDFLGVGELYNAFKKSSKVFQKVYYLYLEQYIDLMPKDIRDEFKMIKSSICTDSLLKNEKEVLDINKEADFINIINSVVNQFRRLIVDEGSYKLLWNDDHSHKKEGTVQLLFKVFAEPRLREYDIDISREVETGRGPVDFKLSHGYELRLLIEIKLASNTSFWHGLEKQLVQYMLSEIF